MRPHNLPAQLTNFIGRARELTEIKRLLSGSRLLTLTGPGGSGKTRLALQAAADVRDRFEDGVFLVELAPIFESSLVIPMIAQVLGVPNIVYRQPLDNLKDHLRNRRVLLVLDNCEQVAGAAPQLVE